MGALVSLGACSCEARLGTGAVGGELGAPGAPGGGLEPGETLPTGQVVPDHCFDTSAPVSLGLTKLRRLTREQLDRSIRDLLGLEANAETTLSPDERIGPFYSNSISPVTELLVQQSQEMAERLAAEAAAQMAAIAPCDLEADTDGSCVRAFVTDLGGRAYRRPLDASEVDRLIGLFDVGRAGGGAERGFSLVVAAILQSPSFLYHVEVGVSGGPSSAPEPIDLHGLAARLSYFLWNSLPDAELRGLADSGALADEVVLRGQIERLFADDRAGEAIASFHRQWLGLTSLPSVTKDPAVHPEFDAELAAAMSAEVGRFTDSVIRNGDGRLATLLTADYGFPEGPLAAIYGVTAASDPSVPVTFPPGQRSGILTSAAFLTRHAHGNQTSPVHRGIVVRENVLCQPLSPPPADVAATVPPPSDATTTRERFAQHVADPSCAGCHQIIDPPGLAFEHYNAVGAYRTHDGLSEVDASGEMIEVSGGLAGPFTDAIELTRKLAESEQVAECVSRQWFRFALGRMESESDVCSVSDVYGRFRESGGDVRQLLSFIVQSDAFRYVQSSSAGVQE